ncbi:MAG: ABC transporter substrate-binding protein [Alphaproteobacteria bacterium]|nr:ABC transporter substrate-binding protein [Alphaproteobacteria bacterium]
MKSLTYPPKKNAGKKFLTKAFYTFTLLGIISIHTIANAENVMTYALKASPHSLDPFTMYDIPTHSFNGNVYEPLVDRNTQLELVPSLATEWKNVDPTTWRFVLRQNVKFHDGAPFTASDVVFSFQRAAGPGSDSAGSVASIKEIKVIDDHTIDVITKTQNPLLPSELYGMFIFSKAWCEKNNATKVSDATKKEESYADRHANGTGPYKVESYQAEVQIVLVKNKDWWGKDCGNIDKAIFKPIASEATRVAALLSGDVDLMAPLPIQDIKRIESDPKLAVIESPSLLTTFLGMNQSDDKLKSTGLDKNPFKDKRVREAFAHAIDIEAIKTKIMRGYSEPNGLFITKGVNGYNQDINTRWKFDLEKAKNLMTEAGYPNGFNLAMDCSNDRYTKDEMICQSVAQMLAKIGVKVNLTAQTKSKFFAKVLGYDTDFYMLGWLPTTYDAHDAYYNLVATRKGGDQGKFNVGGYSNPKLDELINQLHKEMDSTKRNELITEAMKIAQEDVASITLHQEKFVYGVSKRLLNPPIRADDMVFIKDFNVQ